MNDDTPYCSAVEAAALLAKVPPMTRAGHQRKQIARDVVRDLKRHEASIKRW